MVTPGVPGPLHRGVVAPGPAGCEAARPGLQAFVEVGGVSAAAHDAGCTCTRCRGFEPGHRLSTRHGAYSKLQLQPRAAELADELRAHVPGHDPADNAAIALAAMALARTERAMAALEQVDAAAGDQPLSPYLGENGEKLSRLRQDARGWVNSTAKLLDQLALMPVSRGRLGLDVARARSIDLSKLSDNELSELEGLIEAATEDSDA